jgi:hypothetical protein
MASCPNCGGAGTRRSPCICGSGGGGSGGGKCGCNCGYLAGEMVGENRQRWGSGCRGAKAGDPHAAHCGRPGNKCPY